MGGRRAEKLGTLGNATVHPPPLSAAPPPQLALWARLGRSVRLRSRPRQLRRAGRGQELGCGPKHAIPSWPWLHHGGALRHIPASSAHGAP